jgi:hypothetical protein
MQSMREQLVSLTNIQKADLKISHVDCEHCEKRHTHVQVQLPDGYSWDSPMAGLYSGIGITSECHQPPSVVFGEIYSVIGHPVVKD